MTLFRWTSLAIVLAILAGFAVLRGVSEQTKTAEQNTSVASLETESDDFEMYSTLSGKMARMEELMNAIDRFLGDPDFASRIESDAKEFHQLLGDCRELFPEGLPDEQQDSYRDYVDRALEHSDRMQSALIAQNELEARKSLEALDTIRRKSHAKFSN